MDAMADQDALSSCRRSVRLVSIALAGTNFLRHLFSPPEPSPDVQNAAILSTLWLSGRVFRYDGTPRGSGGSERSKKKEKEKVGGLQILLDQNNHSGLPGLAILASRIRQINPDFSP